MMKKEGFIKICLLHDPRGKSSMVGRDHISHISLKKVSTRLLSNFLNLFFFKSDLKKIDDRNWSQ